MSIINTLKVLKIMLLFISDYFNDFYHKMTFRHKISTFTIYHDEKIIPVYHNEMLNFEN